MKQSVFTAPFTIEYQDAPMPVIKDDEVLLKVHAVGICGSDIQMYHGLHKYMTYPVIPGHEVGAEIVEVGKAVKDYKVGDRVTVEPQISCGHCYSCEIGRFNVCESLKVKGVHADGFMADYVACEEKYLHHCPSDMPFDIAALVEPLAVGVGSVKRSHYKGANIAVIGAGTIGNLVAQSAQALGAGHVLITDMMEKKLDYARACGIEHCINTKDISLGEAIDQAFGHRRADVIIDAAGVRGSWKAALEASRTSSEIVITGNFKEPMELEVPRIQRREVNVLGHMMYVREDFADAIRFLAEGTVKSDGFITQRYKPEQYDEAFKFIDANPNDVIKAMIEF